MKIKKLFLLIFVTLICFIPATSVSAKSYSDNVNGKQVTVDVSSTKIDERENQTTVSGVKPKVTSNNIDTKQINDKIEKIYTDSVKIAATARSKSINFDYQVFESDGYISIVITSKIQNATETQRVSSINFKMSNGNLVKISDVIGGKTIDVINNYVNKAIKETNKYDKEITVTENSVFYVENGKPVVVFDSYTLGQNQTKIVTVPVDISRITSYQLSSKEYYVKDSFNLRMIPLRKACEGLYYKVNWNNSTKTFIISDGNDSSTGNLNSTEYSYNNKKSRLENKPEIQKGIIYVPITYFTDNLGLSYKIDGNGTITFYRIK